MTNESPDTGSSIDFDSLRSSLSLRLRDDEIHVWFASLDREPHHMQILCDLLVDEELERVDRYYFERDRNFFIARRGLLRLILSAYLDTKPKNIQFLYGPFGKPSLRTKLSGRNLDFNLSHSDGLAIYAISENRSIGIDVERVRPIAEASLIVEQLFSPNERTRISSLSQEKRLEEFYKIWTCKEACLKATGDGLQKPLDQIEVSLSQGQEVPFLINHVDSFKDRCWHLETIQNITGYQAAIVGERPYWHLRFWYV